MPFKESRLVFQQLNKEPKLQNESFLIKKGEIEKSLPSHCGDELLIYLQNCDNEKIKNVISVKTDEGKAPLINEVVKRVNRDTLGYMERNFSLLNRINSVEHEKTGNVSFFQESISAFVKSIIPNICEKVYLELENKRLRMESMKDEFINRMAR